MKRIAVYAHFDSEDEIKPYVLRFLEALREECERVVFVSTARLNAEQLEKLDNYADSALVRDNVGWDFAMWRDALEQLDIAEYDELVLTNSSVFGPLFPLGPIFDQMAASPSDFWAMTDNFEHRWHLQSYFLVFRRNLMLSEAFRSFWQSVLPYRDKGQVVLSYEVGMTAFFVDSGFVAGAFAPVEAWASWAVRRRMDFERRWNPTLFYPEKLLARGVPFVKTSLLRDNIGGVPLAPIYRAMEQAHYDRELVVFDRAAIEAPKTLRSKARQLWSRVAEHSEGCPSLDRGRWADPPPAEREGSLQASGAAPSPTPSQWHALRPPQSATFERQSVESGRRRIGGDVAPESVGVDSGVDSERAQTG